MSIRKNDPDEEIRGTMVLLTEKSRHLGPTSCAVCSLLHPGGLARSVIVHNDDGDGSTWLLWVFADGYSISDESSNSMIPACSTCQALPIVRKLRFIDSPAIAGRLPV